MIRCLFEDTGNGFAGLLKEPESPGPGVLYKQFVKPYWWIKNIIMTPVLLLPFFGSSIVIYFHKKQ